MIEKFENDVAGYFDECAASGIFDTFSFEEEKKLKEILKKWDIQSGQRILEPGCGSGRLTEYLSHAVGIEGKVFACDISAEMIRIAQKRRLPSHAIFYQGSVLTVPRDNSFFDTVICFQVFPHFSDQARALTEIARVIRQDGNLWINHFKSREVINTFHKNASPVIVSHQIPTTKEMLHLLTQAGFETTEIDEDSLYGYSCHARKI